MSSDGCYIAFVTSNFGSLPASGSCQGSCVHVYDRLNRSTRVIGPTDQLATTLQISDDGEWLAVTASRFGGFFPGSGIGDDKILALHRASGRAQLLSRAPGGALGNGHSRNPSISADGRYVAFDSFATNLIGVGADTNGARDVFRATVDLSLAGAQDLLFMHGFQNTN